MKKTVEEKTLTNVIRKIKKEQNRLAILLLIQTIVVTATFAVLIVCLYS